MEGRFGRSLAAVFAAIFALVSVAGAAPLPQTRYRVVNEHGVAWLEDQHGQKFFSFGVCVIDPGTRFEDYDLANPAYGAWRFYPSKGEWAKGSVELIQSGHFNTVGAWSDYAALLAAPGNHLFFTPIIHSGSSAGFPWLDMWDPKLVKVAEDVTHDLIQSLHHDPRIIGYFSDNELGWWRPAMFNWVWKQKTHGTRRRVIALLKHLYRGSWPMLTRDFDAGSVRSWAQLENRGELYLNPKGHGQAAVAKVHQLLAARYYQLVSGFVHRYDPGALYLGDRYISNYYPEVAAEAGKVCAVVSTNLNASWPDGSYANYFLAGLEKITAKPVMITEFYMSARQNRSGNGNDHSGFPVVETLDERAENAARTLKSLLHDSKVVGAHWFQYYDEPQKGRGDGENYNFGLVDVNNQPYAELLNTFRLIDLTAEHRSGDSKSAAMPSMLAVQGFRLAASSSLMPRGDLFYRLTDEGLELKLYWSEERFTENYFRDGKVAPCAFTRIELGSLGEVSIDPTHPERSRSAWIKSLKFDAASSIDLWVPRRSLVFKNGKLKIGVRLESQSKAYQTDWGLDLDANASKTQP